MTIQQASKQLLFQLFHVYDDREAHNIADLVMENVTEWKRIDRVLNKEVTLSYQKEALLQSYINELLTHRPVQYVLHEAWFYGMKLYVDENVLIPRPETEELVDWIYNDVKNRTDDLHILDIGTGSGCIAMGLKKKLPQTTIFACDISTAALNVAKRNAAVNKLDIKFLESDFLNSEYRKDLPKVDIIVSNPPYIPMHDRTTMHPNVVEHEPHLALFVEDTDPLIFYKAIADFATTNLEEAGAVYVEIHEQMGEQVRALFVERGYQNVTIKNDLQGKSRMVKAASTQ